MFNDPMGDQTRGYDEVQPIFHGGYKRISALSGNNWSNELEQSKSGNGFYADFWNAVLDYTDRGGTGGLRVAQRDGVWGFWGAPTTKHYASENEKDLHTVEQTSKWHAGVKTGNNANGHRYTGNSSSSGEESGWSKIWNSEFMRQVIPDMVNLNINYSVVLLLGNGYSQEVHLITRGPDAGMYNSVTESKRVGLFFDLSAGFSVSRYLSLSANDIRYSDYLGSGKEIGGKLLHGLSVSVSHTGYQPTWVTIGYSDGLSAGTYVGSSTTYPIYGQKFK